MSCICQNTHFSRSALTAAQRKVRYAKMNDSRTKAIFDPIMRGFAAALISAVLLIFVCALCASGSDDPDTLIEPLSAAALLVSAAIGGFVSAHCRSAADSPLPELLTGGAAGLIHAAAVYMIGRLPVSSGIERAPGTALLYLAVAVLGCVGGFIGRRRNTRKVPRRRVPKKR